MKLKEALREKDACVHDVQKHGYISLITSLTLECVLMSSHFHSYICCIGDY